MIPDTYTCPDCGCALDGTPTRPLAWCPLCRRWFTRYGDECTQAQLNRYTEAAKTAPLPRSFDEEDTEFDWDIGADCLSPQQDIAAQPTVKLRKVTPAYTQAEQEIAHLQQDGFTDWEIQALYGIRMAYQIGLLES